MSKLLDNKKEILNQLVAIGLSKNDAPVYLSLLKLGEVGASKIVHDTGLHGQTVYNSLDSLQSKNLVRFSLVHNRKKFFAQDPSILLDLAERQKTITHSVIDSISTYYSAVDTSSVEIIKGQDSFVATEFRLLNELPQGTEIMVLGGGGDSFINSMGKKFNEYEYQRTKKNVSVRYIGNRQQIQYLTDSVDTRKGFNFKMLPEALSGATTISIFPGIAIIMYIFDQESITSILIRNKKIAESYTGFFDGLWKLGS